MTRTNPPDVEALLAQLAANAVEIAALKARVSTLEEELRLAQQHRFGPSSEKHMDRLFNEAEQAAGSDPDIDGDFDAGIDGLDTVDLPDTGLPELDKPEGSKRGRRPLPADLPRERVEYDLPEDGKLCPCCRNPLHRMGEAMSEQLHIEIKAKVLQNVRFKYACRHCDRTGIKTPMVLAPMPAQPLPGSVATPATLALMLANKYVDGTPIYRLSQALGRANVSLSRGAIANWVIRSSQLHLERIYDALKEKLCQQPLIHGDETFVQVLKEGKRDEHTTLPVRWVDAGGRVVTGPVL